MFLHTESYYQGSIPDLSFEEWSNYFNIYTFNLTSDQEQHGSSLPICASGVARLQITFEEAVPLSSTPQILHVMSMYPSIISMKSDYSFSCSYRTS